LLDKDYKEMNSAVLEVTEPIHKSVMLKEVTDSLVKGPGGVYVDATLGMGGHTSSIMTAAGADAKVVAMDVDEEALSIAGEALSKFNSRVILRNSNFSEIDNVLDSLGIREVDGIIADLGMSSFQLDLSGRGFSFNKDEGLDMRMDARLRFTAYDLVNEMSIEELSKLLKNYGEEKWSKRIAKWIVQSRESSPIKTSAELAEIVKDAIPRKFHPNKIHPATKTFQAIRIAVNNELDNIEEFITKAVPLLKVGGRIVVISFHSLEDKMVKNMFKTMASPCICPHDLPICGCGKESILKIITRSPLVPGEDEVLNNTRSRSAKLRVAERI